MSELDRTDVLPVLKVDEESPADAAAQALIQSLTDEHTALERLLEVARAENASLTEQLAASARALADAERLPPAPFTYTPPVVMPLPEPVRVPVDPALAARVHEAETRTTRYFEALQSNEWTRAIREEGLRSLETELDGAKSRIAKLEAERVALATAVEALEAERGRGHPPAPVAALAPAPEPAPAPEVPHARIAELEAVAATLNRALEAQTDAAHLATSQIAGIERTAGELRARVRFLEEELAQSERRGEEHMRQARSADAAQTAAGSLAAELAERLAETERSLVRARGEREEEITALKAKLEQQTLALERARGALEERELQIRRLERSATRRTLDAPAPVASPRSPPAAVPASVGAYAMLRPLDGSEPKALARGRRITIGRAVDNDVCINDPSVSRRHAQIVIGSTGTIIEDLDSANGVGVNGRRVRHAHLKDGDTVTLGETRFVYAEAPRTLASA